MKKALLTIASLLVTLICFAKVANEQDPKYGKGAVPVDENGMVCFEQTYLRMTMRATPTSPIPTAAKTVSPLTVIPAPIV